MVGLGLIKELNFLYFQPDPVSCHPWRAGWLGGSMNRWMQENTNLSPLAPCMFYFRAVFSTLPFHFFVFRGENALDPTLSVFHSFFPSFLHWPLNITNINYHEVSYYLQTSLGYLRKIASIQDSLPFSTVCFLSSLLPFWSKPGLWVDFPKLFAPRVHHAVHP